MIEGARELTPTEIEDLAAGAWILGAGGGGNPYHSLLTLRAETAGVPPSGNPGESSCRHPWFVPGGTLTFRSPGKPLRWIEPRTTWYRAPNSRL